MRRDSNRPSPEKATFKKLGLIRVNNVLTYGYIAKTFYRKIN